MKTHTVTLDGKKFTRTALREYTHAAAWRDHAGAVGIAAGSWTDSLSAAERDARGAQAAAARRGDKLVSFFAVPVDTNGGERNCRS